MHGLLLVGTLGALPQCYPVHSRLHRIPSVIAIFGSKSKPVELLASFYLRIAITGKIIWNFLPIRLCHSDTKQQKLFKNSKFENHKFWSFERFSLKNWSILEFEFLNKIWDFVSVCLRDSKPLFHHCHETSSELVDKFFEVSIIVLWRLMSKLVYDRFNAMGRR